MKPKPQSLDSITLWIAFLFSCLTVNQPEAQPVKILPALLSYRLLPGSTLTDDCPPCGRPTIPQEMRGKFNLRLVEESKLYSLYEVSNIDLTAGTLTGRKYKIIGSGSYTIGTEAALLQYISLEVHIDDGVTNRLCVFTNATPKLTRQWPILDVELVQSNGTFAQVYHLHILAAPIKDLWFSTASDFKSAQWNPLTNSISAGDLLALDGIVQMRNHALTAQLGILGAIQDPGLDAVTVLGSGEILFSMQRDVFSDMHGWLQHGDLLSDSGRLVRRNQELCLAFDPKPSPSQTDLGLDAVQMMDGGEVYFSITESAYSERLGSMLSRGDLLSDRGVMVKSNQELLSRFHPPTPSHDYGLDAIHVWPGGEIWFSVEEGFLDGQLGIIQSGDLLSSEGSIVERNRDLLHPFAPIEDLADFGLDALAVITNDLPAVVSPPTPESWNYVLLDGSQLTDDCQNCDRLPVILPMRGSFQTQLVEVGALFSRWAVKNISFTASIPQGQTYIITGHGTYISGGEVALVQQSVLELTIDDGATNTLCYLTNNFSGLQRHWPMISIHLDQTNGSVTKLYRLDIAAAPLQEIWFSTQYGFHSGAPTLSNTHISDGDLLSSNGRVVKRNHELTAGLGFMPIVPDLGLDAVDILPGGEIAFSIKEDLFSESLGLLHDGDVLSNRGRVLHHYADLIGAFVPQPLNADQGLDVIHTPDSDGNEIFFSTKRDFFSKKFDRTIRHGDLLSTGGEIFRTNKQLVSRLNPADTKIDYGLDAVWIWPSGEIWFSIENRLLGQQSESYEPGDILSDQGYVVYRRAELLSSFKPLENSASLGLDCLFIVSDASLPLPGSRFTTISYAPSTEEVELQWESKARVFQVQRARNVLGPYVPIGEIGPDSSSRTSSSPGPPFFHRLRQW